MFNKILYFGAGTHLEPIIHFSDTKEFVFGDCQPRTEFGCFNVCKKEFYRKFFLTSLEDKIKGLGLTIQSRTVLTNKFPGIRIPNLESERLDITNKPYNLRSATHLKYYISTSLPYDLYENYALQEDISTCDTLLISGHHPHIDIINYIKKPFNLIAYSSTWFPSDLEHLQNAEFNWQTSVLDWILKNPHLIKSYTVVDFETGEKFLLKNYDELYEKTIELLYKCEDVPSTFFNYEPMDL